MKDADGTSSSTTITNLVRENQVKPVTNCISICYFEIRVDQKNSG